MSEGALGGDPRGVRCGTHHYTSGRMIDIHGEGTRGAVLFWHGRQPNDRESLRTLSHLVSLEGVRVLVPDWDSSASDLGRGDLLRSLEFAREACAGWGVDPNDLNLAGWSLGATAAVGTAMLSNQLEVAFKSVVLIAPGDGARAIDPMSGEPLPEQFPTARHTDPRLVVVHGRRDTISHPELVKGLQARLDEASWRTNRIEVDTDHFGIVALTEDHARETVHPAPDLLTNTTIVAEMVRSSASP